MSRRATLILQIFACLLASVLVIASLSASAGF